MILAVLSERRYNLNEYKQQYNTLLVRYNISEKWIDDPHRKPHEIEKWFPAFQKIIKDLNLLLYKIGEHTAEEAIRGFKEETP